MGAGQKEASADKKPGLWERLFGRKAKKGEVGQGTEVATKDALPDRDNSEFLDIATEPLLRKRWKLIVKIGSGAFGQIYKAIDLDHDKMEVAVKTENRKQKRRSLKMDVTVVHKMDGAKHFALFLGSGRLPNYCYLVMEMLGPNLSDLRKAAPLKKFSMNTSLRLATQAVEAIESLHKGGFVHRDVKPSNFAMGMGAKSRTLYIFDFGLSGVYKDKDGNILEHSGFTGFKGTVKYASVNAHKGIPLGRHDDLWMLWSHSSWKGRGMMRGDVPWRLVRDRDDVMNMKEKMNTNPGSLLHPHMPASLAQFPRVFAKNDIRNAPDYTACLRILYNAFLAVSSSPLFHSLSLPLDTRSMERIRTLSTGRRSTTRRCTRRTPSSAPSAQTVADTFPRLPSPLRSEASCSPEVLRLSQSGSDLSSSRPAACYISYPNSLAACAPLCCGMDIALRSCRPCGLSPMSALIACSYPLTQLSLIQESQ